MVPTNLSALADLFVSPGYKQDIPSNMWIAIDQLDMLDELNPDLIFRIITFETKEPCFHPLVKYQFEPQIQTAKQCFVFHKKLGLWTIGLESSRHLISMKFAKEYATKLNREEGLRSLFLWRIYLLRYPNGSFEDSLYSLSDPIFDKIYSKE